MISRSPALTACFAATLLVTGAAADDVNEHWHQRFDVKDGVVVEVSTDDADMTVETWDRDVVEVDVYHREKNAGFSLGSSHTYRVEFEQAGNRIRVSPILHEGNRVQVGILHIEESRYQVKVPSYAALELDADNGDITIAGVAGAIRCTLDDGDVAIMGARGGAIISIDNGDVRIADLAGELTVNTDDGDVEVAGAEVSMCRIRSDNGDVVMSDCAGKFSIETDDASVVLDRMRAESLDIQSDNGNVDLNMLETGGFDVVIDTEDGDVTMTLARDASARLDISVDGGSIEVDLPDLRGTKEGEGTVKGRVGDSEDPGSIEVTTENGDVAILTTR